MNFSILIHDTAERFALRKDPIKRAVEYAPIGEYLKTVREAGVYIGGTGLEAPEAATVLCESGQGWNVQDGPFADTKEQLAGIVMIDVTDYAQALAWTRRFPTAPGRKLELRANLIPQHE